MPTENRLRRVLTLWDLIFYGVVLIQPIAPVGIFGLVSKLSHGHASTAILAAMAAMTLTAWSYGRMAGLYPAAGSAYTYVSHGLNAHLGFLTGWAMFLDYLIIPVINVIYVALTFERLVPQVPYIVWAAVAAGTITLLNLRGIRFAARANETLLGVMTVVLVAFVALAVRYLLGRGALWSAQPFYEPHTFDPRALATATSLAALTYIGFDGVTTLAEEVRDPKRTVPLATVLVCLITGVLSTMEVYLGQRVWPDWATFPNLETAFLDVTRRVGGNLLFQAFGVILIVACFGSGLGGQAGAARLLYGMGRDGVLPRRLFGYLDPHAGTPTRNILLIGLLAFGGAVALGYEMAAELLNFGAFLAFMGVNAAVIREFRRRPGRGAWTWLVLPALGFLFCAAIWLSLPVPAKVAGGVWFMAGLIYAAIRTRGFRAQVAPVDFSDS